MKVTWRLIITGIICGVLSGCGANPEAVLQENLNRSAFMDAYEAEQENDVYKEDTSLEVLSDDSEPEPELDTVLEAYADFLLDYPGHPDLLESEGEESEEGDLDIRFTLLYLDDDGIPELVLANGDYPSNPVKLYHYSGNEVLKTGDYSMYGQMYYTPKKGFLLPMYYLPVGNGEVLLYKEGKAEPLISWSSDPDGKYYIDDALVEEEEFKEVADQWTGQMLLPAFSENRTYYVNETDIDIRGGLSQLAQTAPFDMTPLGAPVIDDSYLKEGELMIKGKGAELIPGIWYLREDTLPGPTWIEFDTVGTFTAHDEHDGMPISGYLKYRGKDPILVDGSIYYLYDFDGTEYSSFEFAPETESGPFMTFSGALYYKYTGEHNMLPINETKDGVLIEDLLSCAEMIGKNADEAGIPEEVIVKVSAIRWPMPL